MNERILHLSASHFPRDGEGNIGVTPEIIAEFAELIVEEMYDFIMVEVGNDNGIPDLGKVKQHFGVK